jgi:shikimate dehydrogenase
VDTLRQFLETSTLIGASLTMPLKDDAFNLVSSNDPDALAARAVNTIVRSEHGWRGFNTDVFGIKQALRGVDATRVLILGSGATARNAILALEAEFPTASVSVVGRSADNVQRVVDFAISRGVNATTSEFPVALGQFDLTISTLPPDVNVEGWFTGKAAGTLFDVAYNPWPSQLAERWASDGANLVSGIEMLIWQAIAQIRVFLNGNVAEPLPNEEELAAVMRQAAEG